MFHYLHFFPLTYESTTFFCIGHTFIFFFLFICLFLTMVTPIYAPRIFMMQCLQIYPDENGYAGPLAMGQMKDQKCKNVMNEHYYILE